VTDKKTVRGVSGLQAIYDNISELYRISKAYSLEEAKSAAVSRCRKFPSIACAVIDDFSKGRGLEVLDRIRHQISITRKFNFPVRPALDPYTSTTLNLYQLEKAEEIGRFFEYPECCVKTFVEDFKITLDQSLLGKLGRVINRGRECMVITSGFVPCTLECKKAHRSGLIVTVERDKLEQFKKLEDELFSMLPHCHPAYFRNYFEYLC